MAISNRELERNVLGAIMQLEGEPLSEWADVVTPEMYTRPEHQQIAGAIDEIIGEGGNPDMVAVASKLKSWGLQPSTYVATIATETATAANLDYWARLLVEGSQRRAAQARLREIADEADNKPMAELRSDLTDVAESLAPVAGAGITCRVTDAVKSLIANLETDGRITHDIATGLKSLDETLVLAPHELTILAGRPSMGKSALAAGIARHAANTKTVVFFSLEMSATAIATRLLAAETGIPTDDLKPGPELIVAANRLHDTKLYFDEQGDITAHAIRARLRKKPDVGLVVVDYLQLLKLGREERHDLRIGAATKQLKIVAREFGCHVLALSQLNRSVENRAPPTPRLSDLRDSGSIEEHADNVLLLYRPSYYDKTADPEEAKLRIAKHRNGPTPTVTLRWKQRTQRFLDW